MIKLEEQKPSPHYSPQDSMGCVYKNNDTIVWILSKTSYILFLKLRQGLKYSMSEFVFL